VEGAKVLSLRVETSTAERAQVKGGRGEKEGAGAGVVGGS